MKKGKKVRIVCLSLVAALFTSAVGVIFGWSAVDNYVERHLGFGVPEVKEENTITYYSPKYDSKESAYAHSAEVAVSAQTEGSVLLKNNNALPLEKKERKISVFGTGSVNIAFGGTGSGNGNGGEGQIDLYTALEAEGFEVNPALHKFYQKKYREGYRRGKGTDMNGSYYGFQGSRNYGYSINEVEREKYSSVRSSYQNYNDVALVVISRSGGEGQDLPTDMSEFYEEDNKHYLELTDEERDLFSEVQAGGFQKVIVLMNTLNPFECGFIEELDCISAALWIGGTGQYGMTGVAKILTGERNPYGRLPDTYAADLLSSPAMQNYGDNRYVDGGMTTTAAYVAYAENIYMGYRYYETRFYDACLGQGNAGDFDYEEEVVYPFGYGLSYTDFSWSDYKMEEKDGQLTVRLSVSNVGDTKGKEVVQLYAVKPYTAHDREIGLEKSAVELVGYAKSRELSVNGEQDMAITFSKRLLSSYDAYEKMTYRMDKGEYLLIPATNAHEASKIAVSYARGDSSDRVLVYRQEKDELFSVSDATGYEITNRFETDRYTSLPDDIKLLSRSDWTGTFPTPYGESGRAGKMYKTMTAEKKSSILSTDHLGENDDKTDYVYDLNRRTVETVRIGEQISNSGEGVKFMDLIDEKGVALDYEDEKWDALVRCMTVEELYRYCSSGAGQCDAIYSIDKRKSDTSDSPMGLHVGTLFPCYPIQAGTWNTEIAEDIAECIAEEALWNDIRGWYAPACNMHRTPFGGRNYEYYSEDGVLSGEYIAFVARTVQRNGLFVQIKHFALNDQDTNRGDRGNFKNDDPYNGLCTYASEQTIREVYLRSFEYGIVKGGAHGVMTSYNRIGDTWAGGHYGLLTEILRNEWGMKGNALTDYAGTFGYRYMNFKQGLKAGNDIWLHPSNAFPTDEYTSDEMVYYMQKAAKHVLYAEANSSRINNQRYESGESVTVKKRIAPWKIFVFLGYAVVLSACAAGIVLIVKKSK